MSQSIIYTCKRCSAAMTEADLEYRGGETKCILCGFRVLVKTKPPVVKRVKAI